MKVKALSNINSGQYEAGDVFETDELTAQQLIDAGAVEATEEAVGEVPAEVIADAPAAEVVPEEVPAAEAPAPEAPKEPEAVEESTSVPEAESEALPVEQPQPSQPTPEQIAEDLGLNPPQEPSDDAKQIQIS